MKILITGTTSGIGKNIVDNLKIRNHDIYTINRRDVNDDNITNYICDLSNIKDIEKLVKKIKELDIDVLINNAASGKVSELEEISVEDIINEITLNFISPLILIKELYPNMIKKKFARIINISSISSKRGTPFLYVYSASKAALDSLTQSVASTSISDGFTINSICPGGINTLMSIEGRKKISILSNMDSEEYQNGMIDSMKVKKLIKSDEVFNLIEFLMDPKSNFINGQSINLCGALEVK